MVVLYTYIFIKQYHTLLHSYKHCQSHCNCCLLIGLTEDTTNDHVSNSPVKGKVEQNGMYVAMYVCTCIYW